MNLDSVFFVVILRISSVLANNFLETYINEKSECISVFFFAVVGSGAC